MIIDGPPCIFRADDVHPASHEQADQRIKEKCDCWLHDLFSLHAVENVSDDVNSPAVSEHPVTLCV